MCVHMDVCVHRGVRLYLLCPIERCGESMVRAFLHRSEIKDRGLVEGFVCGCVLRCAVPFCFFLLCSLNSYDTGKE